MMSIDRGIENSRCGRNPSASRMLVTACSAKTACRKRQANGLTCAPHIPTSIAPDRSVADRTRPTRPWRCSTASIRSIAYRYCRCAVESDDQRRKALPCFIQVNIGEEEQKGGCAIAELPGLLDAAKAAHIEVVGLMCIPPADVEPAPFFALLAELAARHDLSQLSMGMSEDFPTAIMLGATYIRVGTALFGARTAG
jgi:hypothetical protein